MQTTLSIYRLVSDPDGAAEILLDFGEDMAGEPVIPSGQSVQSASYPGAAGAGHFPRGNNETQLSWTRIYYFNTNEQARAFGLAAHAQAPWGRRADLRIEFADGSQLRAANVVLESLEPQFVTEAGVPSVVLSYDAVGGTVSVESSGGFADGNWENQDQTWTAWSDKFSKVI